MEREHGESTTFDHGLLGAYGTTKAAIISSNFQYTLAWMKRQSILFLDAASCICVPWLLCQRSRFCACCHGNMHAQNREGLQHPPLPP